MSLKADDFALRAALDPQPMVIRELALEELSDVAGTFRIKGKYKIESGSSQNFTISLQDGNAAPGTLGVVITLSRGGYSSGTPAVATGSGVSISGTPFYKKSGAGVWQGFNVVAVLPAPGSGTWKVKVDPYATAGVSGDPLVFADFQVDQTA